MLPKIILTLQILREVSTLLVERVFDKCKAYIHYYTYKPSPNPRNVVVVGGSYAGFFCAEELAKTLPSGWRVLLIEKNTHFNHTWLFPRLSVIDRYHELAFMPCPDKLAGVPQGIFQRIQGRVIAIQDKSVILDDGRETAFEYLVMATGLPGRYPSGIDGLQKDESLAHFNKLTENVRNAQRIIIIGGGPVGIEIALDIKSEYSEKEVTLIHSRTQLARKYNRTVHNKCMAALDKSHVEVILGERVQQQDSSETQVVLSNGNTLDCDFLV